MIHDTSTRLILPWEVKLNVLPLLAPLLSCSMAWRGRAVDEVHLPRSPPRWIEADLFRQITPAVEDRRLHFIMEKTIHKSDIVPQQNRLLLPSRYVEQHLLPLLSDAERSEASLDPAHANLGRKCKYKLLAGEGDEAGERRRKRMEMGREHGGLEVKVVVRNQFRLDMKLTRWDASEATVLKGNHWRLITAMGDFKEGDVVEMWAFRHRVVVKEKVVINEETKETEDVDKETVWLCLTLSKKNYNI